LENRWRYSWRGEAQLTKELQCTRVHGAPRNATVQPIGLQRVIKISDNLHWTMALVSLAAYAGWTTRNGVNCKVLQNLRLHARVAPKGDKEQLVKIAQPPPRIQDFLQAVSLCEKQLLPCRTFATNFEGCQVRSVG
jgi:hypothetical protein